MKTYLRRLAHIVASSLVVALCMLGLLLLFDKSSRIARADPGALFVKPDGAGTACTQANPCNLQTALAHAQDGNAIYLAQGTYSGTGGAVITITKSIALYGGWDGARSGEPSRNPVAYRTTLDGESARRVAHISGPMAPTLDGLVIANGDASGMGGYITYDAGGGIYIDNADAFINNCTIISNSAGSLLGNGIGGGVILIGSNARLENNLIISNTARWGGGVRVISRAPVFRHNQFLSNTSTFGGGMYLMWAQALVEDNLFQGNAGKNGGALYLSGANSTIVGNVIRDNQGQYGGGIGINTGAPAVVSGNLILNNKVVGWGGGIRITYNDTVVDNNIIAHNEASEGAGVYVKQASPILRHNTIVRNAGGDGVGLFVGQDATVALTNTILVSHTVGITVKAGGPATLESTLWNGNTTEWSGAGTLQRINDYWGDPAFLDPEDGDYHIGSESAAIDAGVDAGLTTDIDGDLRPSGPAPDIGADELGFYVYLPLVTRSR